MTKPAIKPEKVAKDVIKGMEKLGGKFIRAGGRVFILLNGRRIEVSPDFENFAYAGLQIKFCGIATADQRGRSICQHVGVLAAERARDMRLMSFSALSKDRSRLYVPVQDGSLVEITRNGIRSVPNGANVDSVWLFTATGAQYGRSMQDGSAREGSDRPVGVLTSIEGQYKRELQNRTICIAYGRLDERNRDRDSIEERIERSRDLMLSGLCHVFCVFLRLEPDQIDQRLSSLPRNPWGEFSSYIRTLAQLLYAYAEVQGYPATWADQIVRDWFETFGTSRPERQDDVIESYVGQILQLYEAAKEKKNSGGDLQPPLIALLNCIERVDGYVYRQSVGKLYITTAAELLGAMELNKIGLNQLPKNAQGMGRRLQGSDWATLKILKETDDRQLLRRQNSRRPIGIFRPDASSAAAEETEPEFLTVAA